MWSRAVQRILAAGLVSGITMACTATATADNFTERRQSMVAEVEAMARDTGPFTGRHRLDERVMAALGRVPRHEFVPEHSRNLAYLNRALPIGHDQTISQPYIVALMTDLARIEPGDRVLEIGTGSGYQAAILAELAAGVYTIEIIEPLGRRAEQVLVRLGYDNVKVRIGDGYRGWPDAAPFDAILVTAAPEEVPPALIEQLAPGGRMVVPVGPQGQTQTLRLLEKDAAGELKSHEVLPVGFVPMISGDE